MNVSKHEGLIRVYHDHRPALLRMLTARTGEPSDAEDLLQELWIRVQRQPPVEVQHARAYLFRMAQNLLTDRMRARQRRMTRERRWSDEATDFAPSMSAQVDHAKTAEQLMLEREDIATLASAIASLPDGARRAFELHKIDGVSQLEVADRLGISKSGVEKHMAVAIKYLRRALMN
jgi:RNA polymerase sigma-70 factor (ECF subfamily)